MIIKLCWLINGNLCGYKAVCCSTDFTEVLDIGAGSRGAMGALAPSVFLIVGHWGHSIN